MIFRQLFDKRSSTYTYLVADPLTREAVLIDSVKDNVARDQQLIQELGVSLKYIFETHIHADHITGASDHKKRYPSAKIVVDGRNKVRGEDETWKDGESRMAGSLKFTDIATPGHTKGCSSILAEGLGFRAVFTGDALLIRGCGRTDFQGGSSEELYDSVTQKLFVLGDDTLVYPAHDYNGRTCSSIGEERRYNPRLSKDRAYFLAVMAQLKLGQPAQIKVAVPANEKLGDV